MTKRYLTLLIILILLPMSLSYAQTSDAPDDGTIFAYSSGEGGSAVYFPVTEWMPDGQSFVFGVFTNENYGQPHWLQYVLPTNELRSLDLPPSQMRLSSEQQTLFGAIGAATISPDGNLAIYPTVDEVCGEGGCSKVLALGDLKTGQHVTIHKSVDDGNFIRWSEGSSAFLIVDIGQYGGLGGIYYGKVPADIASTSSIELVLLANYSLGDISYVDISPDGHRVLVRKIDEQTGKGLYVWDAHTPSSGQQFAAFFDGKLILADQVVAGASFIADDEQHLLIVVDGGIIRYDLETDQFEVINPHISSQSTKWMYFSPNSQYGVVSDGSLHTITSEGLKLVQVHEN